MERRTTCLYCDEPLTGRQQMRRRRFCSRRCAKLLWHQQHRGLARAYLALGHAGTRRKYAARVAERLRGCRTLGDAYRLGYRLGYTVGANRRRIADRRAA